MHQAILKAWGREMPLPTDVSFTTVFAPFPLSARLSFMKNLTTTVCLAVALLLGSGGVSQSSETKMGPSFDCGRASTPTEYAICASATLSMLDRALAEAYSVAKENFENASDNVKTLRDEQRHWNKERSSKCGDHVGCLSNMYERRIKILQGNDFDSGSHTNCSNEDREYAKFWDNYYHPEDAYQFGEKIKKLVKEENLEGLFSLVDGELTSGPRQRFIKGKKFSDIFSDNWVNDLLTSGSPCSPVGWRGFMLENGSIWFNRTDGKWRIFSINGAKEEDIRGRNADFGEWRHKDNIISPKCFPYEYWSGDNFEAIAEHYSIEYSDDFSKNMGKYIGKEIVDFEGIPEPWDGGKYHLFIIRDLDTCPHIKEEIKYEKLKGIVTYTDRDPTVTDVYQIRYRKVKDISLQLCEELAPNFDGTCVQSSIFVIGDWAGGSRGFAWRTYIYGLFKAKNDRDYIIPLKSWFGHSKNDALEFYDQWKSAQQDCQKGTIEYMKTGKCLNE